MKNKETIVKGLLGIFVVLGLINWLIAYSTDSDERMTAFMAELFLSFMYALFVGISTFILACSDWDVEKSEWLTIGSNSAIAFLIPACLMTVLLIFGGSNGSVFNAVGNFLNTTLFGPPNATTLSAYPGVIAACFIGIVFLFKMFRDGAPGSGGSGDKKDKPKDEKAEKEKKQKEDDAERGSWLRTQEELQKKLAEHGKLGKEKGYTRGGNNKKDDGDKGDGKKKDDHEAPKSA